MHRYNRKPEPNFRRKKLASTCVALALFSSSSGALLGACSDSNSLSAQERSETSSQPVDRAGDNPAQTQKPRNIVVFIGDGMGVSTITAARIFDGQSRGLRGEEHVLAFEDFANLALIKTYNTNSQVADSAGTATAILSGYKTNIGTVNVPPADSLDAMVLGSCGTEANPPATLTTKAKRSGRSVGVISTARLTHATPAAMYGHAVSRDWEADKDIEGPILAAGCTSLSEQLVMSEADLLLGGGAKEFSDSQVERFPGAVVRTASEMNAAPDGRMLGLFNSSHMSFEADRAETDEPSLAEMTRFAMDRLSANRNGYVLMVEAGRVDHAHHGTNAYRAMRDMQALNEAVAVAKETMGDDTLILVTADHSHVFSMSGYPTRGNPILGLVKSNDRETGQPDPNPVLAEDGKPYTTLGYHNGPNVRLPDSPALTDNMVQSPDYRQQTAVPLGSETHAGEDVPLYATGPGSDQVRGVMEQDEIGKLIERMLE